MRRTPEAIRKLHKLINTELNLRAPPSQSTKLSQQCLRLQAETSSFNSSVSCSEELGSPRLLVPELVLILDFSHLIRSFISSSSYGGLTPDREIIVDKRQLSHPSTLHEFLHDSKLIIHKLLPDVPELSAKPRYDLIKYASSFASEAAKGVTLGRMRLMTKVEMIEKTVRDEEEEEEEEDEAEYDDDGEWSSTIDSLLEERACKDDDSKCTICIEGFVLRERMVKMPCLHLFHKKCSVRWLRMNNSCPVCRYEI